MRKFFSNKKLIIIMIVVILTFGMISASVALGDRKAKPNFVHQMVNDSIGIIGNVVAIPLNGIHNLDADVHDLANTYQENKRLKSQLADLAQIKAQVATLKKENKSLKQQVRLNKTLIDYHQMSAVVISRSPNNWQNYIIVNKGTMAGVQKNMPVMSGSGLIGRVTEVNRTNSKVSLISTDKSLSNKFAVEVLDKAKSDTTGIIGHYNQEQNLLVMTNVASTEGVQKGQKVITSGLGGLTPRGLFVGKVYAVKKDDYGLVSSIYVKPATDLNNFNIVTIISRDVEHG